MRRHARGTTETVKGAWGTKNVYLHALNLICFHRVIFLTDASSYLGYTTEFQFPI